MDEFWFCFHVLVFVFGLLVVIEQEEAEETGTSVPLSFISVSFC